MFFLRKFFKVLVIIIFSIGVFYLGLFLTFQPSHDRQWEFGQEVLPYISFTEDGEVVISGFRNFNWHNDGSYEPNYETRAFTLNDINSVYIIISEFADFEGLAHIFLSFGLVNGEKIVISLEARRESHEDFSAILGMLRQFEIIYVVGSEEDIIGLRTDVRDERVYVYKSKASPEKSIKLFLALVEDINNLYVTPQMYNTLTRNCTNEITRRVEDISDVNFPFTWKTTLPGYFDEVLYDLGLIDTKGTFEEVRARHSIDNNSVNRNDKTFSADLRR